MNLLLELFLFTGIIFPIYHILNVIPTLFKKRVNNFGEERAMSIIIPCYNEERIIATTIEGIQRMNYQNYECIFVNDGSSDHTMRNMKRRLKLKKTNLKKKHNLDSKKIKSIYRSSKYPNILVLDKENGGKSDALNAGISFSKNDYLITLDADSILHVNALKFVNEAFNDPDVVAVSGIIQILQSFILSKDTHKTTLKLNPLLKLQTIEYIKSCFCYKASLAKLNSLLVISGAFGVFRKDIILDVNGFNHLIGEDLDLTLRIQFKIEGTNQKIVYMPDAICYTEGPETFRDFLKQRVRWQKSFIESLFTFKKLIFKNTFKKTLPFFMIIDALFIGVLSSFIIFFFYLLIINNIINGTLIYVLPYFIVFVSVHLLYNIVGLLIARYYDVRYYKTDIIRLLTTIILDITIYRFAILYTIILGSISYFTDKKAWNKVSRSGRNYNVLKRS